MDETREGCRLLYRGLARPVGVVVVVVGFIGVIAGLTVDLPDAVSKWMVPIKTLGELLRGTSPASLYYVISLTLIVVGVALLEMIRRDTSSGRSAGGKELATRADPPAQRAALGSDAASATPPTVRASPGLPCAALEVPANRYLVIADWSYMHDHKLHQPKEGEVITLDDKSLVKNGLSIPSIAPIIYGEVIAWRPGAPFPSIKDDFSIVWDADCSQGDRLAIRIVSRNATMQKVSIFASDLRFFNRTGNQSSWVRDPDNADKTICLSDEGVIIRPAVFILDSGDNSNRRDLVSRERDEFRLHSHDRVHSLKHRLAGFWLITLEINFDGPKVVRQLWFEWRPDEFPSLRAVIRSTPPAA